jgi:hypothetical protein
VEQTIYKHQDRLTVIHSTEKEELRSGGGGGGGGKSLGYTRLRDACPLHKINCAYGKRDMQFLKTPMQKLVNRRPVKRAVKGVLAFSLFCCHYEVL